jgi:hypothetical protein
VGVFGILMGAGYFFSHRPATRLTDKDTIVLADFANSTGDPVFDDALKQALSIQLAQSPFLNILSDRKVCRCLADDGTLNHRARLQRMSRRKSANAPRARQCSPVPPGQTVPHRRERHQLRQWRFPGAGTGAGGNEGRSHQSAWQSLYESPSKTRRIAQFRAEVRHPT